MLKFKYISVEIEVQNNNISTIKSIDYVENLTF